MSKKEQIYKMRFNSAIIHACLSAHQYNEGVTYTDALEEMVLALAETNKALELQLLDYIKHAGPIQFMREV